MAAQDEWRRAIRPATNGATPPLLSDHTLAVMQPGEEDKRVVIVFGGYAPKQRNMVNSAYEYDPELKTWAEVNTRVPVNPPPLPPPNEKGEKGKVDSAAAAAAAAAQNVGTGEFTDLKPAPRSEHAACVVSPPEDDSRSAQTMFVFGGSDRSKLFNDLWMLRRGDNKQYWQWQQLPAQGDVPCPRSGHTLTALDDHRLLVIGGFDGTQRRSDVYMYDLLSQSWRVAECSGLVPSARDGHGVALIDRNLYLIGGFSFCNLCDVHVLNTDKWEWSLLPPNDSTPLPRMYHSVYTYQGKVFVQHGSNGVAPIHDVMEFDPTTTRWHRVDFQSPQEPLERRARQSAGFSEADKKCYVFGGVVGIGSGTTTTYSNALWEYEFGEPIEMKDQKKGPGARK